ncbi:ARM repeat-containing protein [Coemansia reversa NRRL 1564]|uniref:ARM repeat-containing protein n=1 Tax=Coemansia reversa (strain ATCC 12441 / NRRL 1564) TaxID=763665 RepID=A0A2G5B4G3_COERN|nr:ARM repeat-containing protein [Coemansia reversa NRRL 1564]|eukprot:PIA13890.1 ARM repeat-containing protein [Coemansia reversa NRRL 1564]
MGDSTQGAKSTEVGSVPTFFWEHEEFLESLEKVVVSAKDADSWTLPNPPNEEQELVREMCKILEAYQEKPTCLDPYLERIVSKLMAVAQEYVSAYHDNLGITDASISMTRLNGIFDLLYTVCKVRGYKIAIRFFPHTVADVEPVFSTLWRYSVDFGASNWTARYVLLIWLSLLAMIPFDIESIDSGLVGLPAINMPGSNNDGSLLNLWIELGKIYLSRPGCEMEGAAVMLARLLSRKDTATLFQPKFIKWAVCEINEAAGLNGNENNLQQRLDIESVLRINGALRVLCHLFAVMDSPHSLGEQVAILQRIFQSEAFEQNSITRKLISKAAQRMALLMLSPAPVNPKLLHAQLSVRNNLGECKTKDNGDDYSAVTVSNSTESDDGTIEQMLDTEIPEDVECFLGILLHRLHDKDTIVRWSASKGVGRIAERLPVALAKEIVSAVANILKEETMVDEKGVIDVSMTAEFSWHGALLCLAELSRRGLLYSQLLRDIVPWVGLTYEIQRGDYSVGANVRDAACYVMWSFARIPNPSAKRVLAEMSTNMATALISVAVFDRESNVRRAASAAFQEHVGRQGTFPHGISVLQLADFFSVGIMRNAYVVAGRRIAEFEEYRHPLLHHLCTVTIYHWDVKTRELAVKALRELAPLSPEYMRTILLPGIVAHTSSPFLAVRHGAITAAGAVAEVLAANLSEDITASKEVLSVADNVPARYVEDFGASMTLAALASYIGSLSRAGWNIGSSDGSNKIQRKYFDYFVQALTTCRDVTDIVRELTAFVDAYGLTSEQRSCIEEYTRVDRSGTSRESFVLALGVLSDPDVANMLCGFVSGGATVEIRTNAAMALGQFCERVQGNGSQSFAQERAAVEALSRGLDDHSVDNRGDVGSWVRKQSLRSLARIFKTNSEIFARLCLCEDDFSMQLLGQIVCAATEKIDKLRAEAGRVLEIILFEQNFKCDGSGKSKDDAAVDPHIGDCLMQLRRIISDRPAHLSLTGNGNQDISVFSWADPEAAFARIVHALSVNDERLRQPLFEGFVLSGSVEPLGKLAVSAVAAYTETLPASDSTATVANAEGTQLAWSVDGVVAELTRLILTDRRTSRMINPALIVADQLIEQGALLAASAESWIPLYRAVQRVAFKLRAPMRLSLCLKLYSSLALMSDELARLAAESLLVHIGHPTLKIRQTAADHLFALVCIHGAVDVGDDIEEIELLLAETEWAYDKDEVRTARTRLAELVRRHIRQ